MQKKGMWDEENPANYQDMAQGLPVSRSPGVLVSWLSGKRTLTAGKEGGDWGRKANEVAS